jgi:hypothetical protein
MHRLSNNLGLLVLWKTLHPDGLVRQDLPANPPNLHSAGLAWFVSC